MTPEVFRIVPGSANVYWVVVPALIVMLLVGGGLGYAVRSSRHVQFEVSQEGIRIRGDMYGRFIPRREILCEQARAVDLLEDSNLSLSRRTNGLGLPGYQSGWFRLNDGEKALVFLTDKRHVAYVPTSSGYALMVSVPDPAKMVESLRKY